MVILATSARVFSVIPIFMGVTLPSQSHLISFNGSIALGFDFVDPFATNAHLASGLPI